MSSWTIYSKDGVAKASVKELELHDEWMAESYLTISVKSPVPIDFAVDDYIDYRDERYAIQYDPTLLKKARSGSYGEGFTYDNIKFVNEAQAKIVRCDFNDIVLAPESESNKIHYSTLPTFPFYCETVDDLLDRILANLEDLYPGEFTIIGLNTVRNQERGELTHNDTYIEEYKKWIDPTMTPNTDPYGKIGVAEAVDNINCWNALAKVNEDFGLNFILRGYTIIVGTVGVFTSNKFRYGKGNGLYEIERISDSEQQIITRLRAYGSDANLPSRYYANLNMECYGVALADGVGSTTVDIDFKKSLFKNEFNGSEVAVGLRIGSTEYPDSVAWINGVTGKTIIHTHTNDPIAKDTKVYFISGINRDEWPVGSREYATENLPDNMAISRLMLPGFPNKSLYDWVIDNGGTVVDEEKGIATINDFTGAFSKDKYRPYIDSPNTELYSIRPASIYFDGSNDTEEIHPTIEGMTYQGHAIDVITSAEQITDNGVYKEGETAPNFKITLPDLGFDLKEAWVENATINMKDGMCSARAFVIASQPKLLSNGKWECSCKREHDDTLDLWFPYNDFQIKAGDHYVLTGIDMPDAYVNAASERLFTAAIDALVKNHASRFTFQPRIDELWMQRQHDQHLANPTIITSLHDTLKSGDIFAFADDDLGIDANIIIDVLTIKENGNNDIPTYEITLRDEKQVGLIQKIQNKVDSIISGATNINGNGASPAQIQSIIKDTGGLYFLSKLYDDIAQGKITFEDDITFDTIVKSLGAIEGFAGGRGILLKVLHGLIESDNLNVRNFAHVLNEQFDGILKSLGARNGFTDGKGIWMDALEGLIETDGMNVRGFLRVMELIINRLQLMESDYSFTEGDTVDHVSYEDNGQTLVLQMHKDHDNDYTPFYPGDIIYGIKNDLLPRGSAVPDGHTPTANGSYFKTWMRVKSVDLANNVLRVALYQGKRIAGYDEEHQPIYEPIVPGGSNFSPYGTQITTDVATPMQQEADTVGPDGYDTMLTVTRHGNVADGIDPATGQYDEHIHQSQLGRQQAWVLSTTDKRLTFFWRVDQPIILDDMYALCLGILPELANLPDWRNRDMPSLYVNTIFYDHQARANYPAKVEKVDRGQWSANPTSTYESPYEGTYIPDGTLDATDPELADYVAQLPIINGYAGTYATGDTIPDGYHYRTFTMNQWLTYRLDTAHYGSMSDKQMLKKMYEEWREEVDLEVSRTWNYGMLWECLRDDTTNEPKWDCLDWQVIGGDTLYYCEIESSAGTTFRNGNVDTILSMSVRYGQEDVIDRMLQKMGTTVQWIRKTGWDAVNHCFIQTSEDREWQATQGATAKSIIVTRNDMGSGWMIDYRQAMFCCSIYVPEGDAMEVTEYPAEFIQKA